MHRDMFKIQDGVAIVEKLNCSIMFLSGGSVCLFTQWKAGSCGKTFMQSLIEF